MQAFQKKKQEWCIAEEESSIMLKYIKNELKPKEQNKYMNTLKNLDTILHEQLLEIIDSQIFNGASILNAIKICNELKRNLQDFYNAA